MAETTGNPSPDPETLLTRLPGSEARATDAPDPPETRGSTTSPEAPPWVASTWPTVPGYEILAELGRGGMGVVYRARQEGLNRVVALKMILGGAHAGGEELARFKAEAATLARLHHPHIVQVYDVGESGGLPFFSLEYVDGGSLYAHTAGTPQPPELAARLVQSLARAVHAAHQAGVLHRDLKPANVLLASGGREPAGGESLPAGSRPPLAGYVPKISDFGLAKQLGTDSNQTQSGAVMGTPSYMAPEQAAGHVKELGPACDVYALGAILYELLTGRPPFKGPTMVETLLQVRTEEPVSPRRLNPAVPRDLEPICLKCLQKDPRRRYAAALALADDLRRWTQDEPIRARPVGAVERLVKWARRRPAVAALGALVLLVTALGVALVFWQWQRAEAKAIDEARARTAEEVAKKGEEKRREEAERALRLADAERRAREREFYLSTVALAQGEWLAGNASRVEDLLNECPTDLRGWEWRYLKGQTGAALLTFLGHKPAAATAVALSPDGRRAVSGDSGHRLKVWDVATGRVAVDVQVPGGQYDGIRQVAFSPDGTRVAAACGADGTVRLWEASTGRPQRVLQAHAGGATGVSFSPDGQRLASSGKDGLVKVWDRDGKVVLTLRGHDGPARSVAYSPDGARLASGCSGAEPIRLWDAATGKELRRLGKAEAGEYVGTVVCLAFRPGGRQLATASEDFAGGVRVWDVEAGRLLHVPAAHAQPATALAYSADGRTLAGAGQDPTIKVWDADTGRESFALHGHAAAVTALAARPDGRLVSASSDGTIRVWDGTRGADAALLVPGGGPAPCSGLAFSPDGRRVVSAAEGSLHVWEDGGRARSFPGFPRGVVRLSFSPDGRRLASATADGEVRLWDPATGEPGRLLRPAGRPGPHSSALRFSPDSARLAWAGGDGSVRVWETDSGKEVVAFQSEHLLHVPQSESVLLVGAVTFSDNGRRFASGGSGGEVRLWDVGSGQSRTLPVPEHVTGLAFDPGGQRLAVAQRRSDNSSAITLWNVAEGRELRSFAAHPTTTWALAFTPDGRRLATAGWDRTVRVWDPDTGRELVRLNAGALSTPHLAFSPDGRRLAAAAVDGVRVWDAPPTREVLLLGKNPIPVSNIAYSPDGLRLAGPGSERVTIWDAASGRTVRTLGWNSFPEARIERGTINVPLCVAYSPDGRQLVVGGGNETDLGVLRLWDARTGEPAGELSGHGKKVRSLSFSPDGLRLAAADEDHFIKVWDVAARKAIATFRGHTDLINGVAFSPDGKHVASGGRDRVVRIWDAATAAPVAELRGHSDRIASLAYRPDGQRIVSVGGPPTKGEVKVWDVATGAEVLSLAGHDGMVLGVGYSPDGRRLVTAGEDRMVRVWDADTGKKQLELKGHLDLVMRAHFSPDGRRVVSSGWDMTVRVWDVTE